MSSALRFIFNLLLLLVCAFKCSCGSKPSVIVVGAGAAGIAAATKLLENNITEVKILEADVRIGGRIHSVEFGDAVVDLGAEWCDGQVDNVVYEMVKDLQILNHTDVNSFKFFYSTREKVDKDLEDKLLGIIREIYHRVGQNEPKEGLTMGDYCIKEYNSSVAKLHLNDSKQIQFANNMLSYFEKYVISLQGSFSWITPSARSDYKRCDGESYLNWAGYGYKTILDVMMGKFPNNGNLSLPIDDKILFNKQVTDVIWGGNDKNSNGVKVQCADGSVYNADHVIFTPSLGVLKENYMKMFSPKLPKYKNIAINKLGFNVVLKVILHYPSAWWPQEGFHLVWSQEDRHLRDLKVKNLTWALDLIGFYPSPNNSNVLTAWFAGWNVLDIERLGNDTLLRGIKVVLEQFLGDSYNVTCPDSFFRYNWLTNRYFRGSYSYQTVNSRLRKSNADLAEPLSDNKGRPVVLFAGEATHNTHYSTVHGAIETGHREANRVVSLYNVL